MPGYRDHMLFGSILALVFAYVVGPVLSYGAEVVIVSTVFALLASVFPDVDHSRSMIHRRVKAFVTVLASSLPLTYFYPDPALMLVGGLSTGVAAYLVFARMKPRHRTVTHTFNAAVAFSSAVGILSFLAFQTVLPAVFAFLAYMSHLALDQVF